MTTAPALLRQGPITGPAGPASAGRLLLLTGIAPALWGTTYLISDWLPPDRPLLAATVRALPAGLLLLALAPRLPTGSWWWRAAVLGILNIGAFFALLFWAAYELPGGVAATLGAVQPLVVAGLSVLLGAERLRVRTIVAGLGAVVGVGLLVLRADAALSWSGVAAGLASTVSMAVGVVLTKRWERPAGTALTTQAGWILTAGGLFLVPVTLAFEGVPSHVTAGEVSAFAFMVVVTTALAYALWVNGIARLPASNVSALALLSPLVATGIGVAVVGERMTAWQVSGFVLTVASLLLAQSTLAGRPPRASSSSTLVDKRQSINHS